MSDKPRSHVALVAVRMSPGPRTTEPQAIVIGTMPKDVAGWKEHDWRYACYPLSVLRKILADPDENDPLVLAGASGLGLKAKFATPADVIKAASHENEKGWDFGRLHENEHDAVDEVGIAEDFLDDEIEIPGAPKKLKRFFSAFPLRHIEQMYFYTFAKGSEPALGSPFAALDTARVADGTDAPKDVLRFDEILPMDGEDAGSRIVLLPDFSKGKGEGALSAFSIHLEIKTAVSGHLINGEDDEKRRRAVDPRMLIDAGIRNRPTPLWPAEVNRGASFDVLKLRCSLSSGKKSVGITRAAGIRDLLRLATSDGRSRIHFQPVANEVDDSGKQTGTPYLINVIPAADALGIPRPKDSGRAHRRFGFRFLSGKLDAVDKKIGWRFETSMFQYAAEFASAAVKTVIADRIAPGNRLEKQFDSGVKVTFEEEQRRDDIRFEPDDRSPRTLLTVRFAEDDEDDQAKLDEKITRHVLSASNEAVSLVHDGLKRVRDGRPISLLPHFERKTSAPWNAVGFIDDPARSRRLSSRFLSTRTSSLIAFEPALAADVFDAAETRPIEASATFPLLVTTERDAPSYELLIDASRSEDETLTSFPTWQPLVSTEEITAARGTSFTIELKKWRGDATETLRRVLIGALELTLDEQFVTKSGVERIGRIVLLPLPHDGGHAAQLRIAIDARIPVPIERVLPGGQDEPEREFLVTARERAARNLDVRRPDPFAPLLLPLSEPEMPANANASLKLTAEEVVTRDRDHTIALQLRAIEEAGAVGDAAVSAGRVLVIDPRPFRIAAVEYRPIALAATSESNEVAVWNADGEGGLSWRVRDDGQSIALELPPQVIGEAMEKNRSGVEGLPRDIEPGKPSAARFGSPTRLRIDPTFADTRFREPGWNLRRILGNALQRLPGARLLDLRLELLYGLLTRVRTEGLWITELAGALGEPALPFDEDLRSPTPFVADYKRLVAAILETERFRLAIDKTYRTRPDESLRIDEGASFRIRLRELDAGGGVKGGPVTPLRFPIAGGIPPDPGGLIKPEVLERTFSTSDRDRDSFPGGLAWAFESANILMRVYGRPQSDGGSVSGLHLSAHGGYASQRALFDARRTIVETETTQGRVQRYRLERIGRIGCLWHPAKHVIIYERTVVPSAQFYNKRPPIGLRQDEHAGRAIPRKVEEFVEILKPLRHYPEDGTSVRASGCFLSAEFKSIKIRVDSSWGSDVRREGWQVPLWNTDFEGLVPEPNNPDSPANLYPKPQIQFTFAGKDGPCVREVDEPAKLVFYTSVVDGEDDRTDLWKPVRDVDFCDVPKISAGRVQTESEDLTDALLPPEPPHVPGYERFTIGLVPSREAAALAFGRAADGPTATLRNLTIARAVALQTDVAASAPGIGRALGEKAANVRAELDRRVGRVVASLEKLDRDSKKMSEDAKALISDAFSRFKIDLGTVPGEISNFTPPNPDALCSGLANRARAEVDGQLVRFTKVAEALLEQSVTALQERIDAAAGVVEIDLIIVALLADRADEMAAALEAAPEEQKERLRAAARQLAADARASIIDLRDDAAKRISARIKEVQASLVALPADLRADLDDFRKKTKANLSAVRALLGSAVENEGAALKGELDALLTEAKTLLDEVEKCVQAGIAITDKAKEHARAVRAKVVDARAQLGPLQKKVVEAKAPDAVQRLLQAVDRGLAKVNSAAEFVESAKANQAAKPFFDAVKDARDVTEVAVDALKNDVDKVTKIGLGHLDKIEKELDGILVTALAAAERLIVIVETPIPTIVAKLKEVDDACKGVLTAAGDEMLEAVDVLEAALPDPDLKVIAAAFRDFRVAVNEKTAKIRKDLSAAFDEVERVRRLLNAEIEKVARDVKALLDALKGRVGVAAGELIKELQAACGKLFKYLTDLANDAQNGVKDLLAEALQFERLRGDLERRLLSAVDSADAMIADIKAKVAAEAARVTREAEARVREVSGAIQQTVQSVVGADLAEVAKRAEGIYQKGDNALRLIRAVGDPPKTDSLGFNRPEVAYVFGEAKELGIDMTPTLALVNRAADQVAAIDQAGKAVGEVLDSFGIRLPVNQLADQLIPQKLRNLSVSDLLPDMGGIDFRGLLQRVGIPELDDSDAVKVRHGFDKASRRVWMEAELDIPFGEAVPLMSFGPVQIMIDTARFSSQARLATGAGGGLERKMNGRIFGDWRVVSGGQTILTFRQTELRFDDSGRIDFRIQPERVELAEALRFITDLMRATGQKGGLRIEPLMRGGVPSGVAATLDMVLPPIQSGAFGVSDLSLHVLFGIAAIPQFEILSELAIGSRLTPFSLNVWLLTGGGYMIQRLSYMPMAKPRPLLTYTLDIAVVVGLGVSFSFGVVSGGAHVQVGCGIAMTWTTGPGGNTTSVRVFLLVRGNVDVAGIVTASISLLFEISYDGERMIGAGTLTIRIKISEFYKLSVDEHVEYVFAGEKKQQQVGSGSSADAFC